MRFAELNEWLDWQETLHPTGMDLGLDRCKDVLVSLEWEAFPFPVITVAGTNGKGSTVAFIEQLFRSGGYRTGTYTSPHLVAYNERIQVDGAPVSDETIMASFARIDAARGDTTVTYFEYGTFAAVDIFRRAEVDVAILEVGIGGGLDAVNTFDADVAVITPIAVDHTKWLGDDREAIAVHKAGICRAGRPVVIADPMPPLSLAGACDEIGAVRAEIGRDFRIQCLPKLWEWHGPERSILELPYPTLYGSFQASNAAAAIMAAHELRDRLPLTDEAIAAAVAATDIRGRYDRVPGSPAVILDIAHNPHAAQGLARSLTLDTCYGFTRAVVAMLNDKDHLATLAELCGIVDEWYVAPLDGARGGGTDTVVAALHKLVVADVVHAFDSVNDALDEAAKVTGEDDRIVVFGSCHTVGEAMSGPLLAPRATARTD